MPLELEAAGRSLWGVGVVSGQRPQNQAFVALSPAGTSFPSGHPVMPQASSKRGLKPVWLGGARGLPCVDVAFQLQRGCGGEGCGSLSRGFPPHPHPQCLAANRNSAVRGQLAPGNKQCPAVLTATRMWACPACGA